VLEIVYQETANAFETTVLQAAPSMTTHGAYSESWDSMLHQGLLVLGFFRIMAAPRTLTAGASTAAGG
jgi:hypothetical protein